MPLKTRYPHHRRSALLQLALCGVLSLVVLVVLTLQDGAPQVGGASGQGSALAALALPASLLLLFQGWAAWRYLLDPARSRPAFLVSSLLLLPVIPIGTAVGLYSLWVALCLTPPDRSPPPHPPSP